MNLDHFNKMSSGLFSHLQNYPPSAVSGIFVEHRQSDIGGFNQDTSRRYRPPTTSNVDIKPRVVQQQPRASNHHSSSCNIGVSRGNGANTGRDQTMPNPGNNSMGSPLSAAAAAAAAAAVTAAPPPPLPLPSQQQQQQQQQAQQLQQLQIQPPLSPPSSRQGHVVSRTNHGQNNNVRVNHVTNAGCQSEPRKSKSKRIMDPGDGRYFPCDRCSKIFVSQRNLDSHAKTHTNLRPLKCLDCGKSFTLRNTLICHMRVHTKERPYTCSICFKSFTQASSLKAHVICVHTKQYPHQCTQCGRGFISPSQRREHDVRFHSKKPA